MRNITIIVRVDFPALGDLVAFLKQHNDQQTQIDALAAQVNELTAKLHTANTGLQGSVEHQT